MAVEALSAPSREKSSEAVWVRLGAGGHTAGRGTPDFCDDINSIRTLVLNSLLGHVGEF